MLNTFCKGKSIKEVDRILAKYQRIVATQQLNLRLKVTGLKIGD